MKTIARTPIKFGLIGSGVHIIIFLIYYFTGANPLLEMYVMDMFVLPVFLYFGIKEHRDFHNDRLLSFGQGMTNGLILYMTLATLTAGFSYLFLELIDTTLVASYIDIRMADLVENKDKIIEKVDEASYQSSVDQLKDTTAKVLALDNFLKRVAIGFLLTSIISLVMKKTEK